MPNCLQGFGCRRAQLHPELAEEQARRRRRRWSCASVKNLEALTWQVGNREREREEHERRPSSTSTYMRHALSWTDTVSIGKDK